MAGEAHGEHDCLRVRRRMFLPNLNYTRAQGLGWEGNRWEYNTIFYKRTAICRNANDFIQNLKYDRLA